MVHRLVAAAWVNKVIGKDYVNHKNGIKIDNRACNLEWCTKAENCQHAWRTGLNHCHPDNGKWNKGKKHRLGHTKKVFYNGIVYSGAPEASRITGKSLVLIYNHCKGMYKNQLFKYV